MKRYKIIYLVGKNKRESIIEADNLDHAVMRADEKFPKWVDVVVYQSSIDGKK